MSTTTSKTPERGTVQEITFLFASVEHRALDVVTFIDALPRLCRGALVECDLGTSSGGDHLVCVARLAGSPDDDTRSRLEFWAWQAGGTASRGGRQGLVALRACDLIQPRVTTSLLGSAARELLGRFLLACPDPLQARLSLRLSLAKNDASGLTYDSRRQTLFVPSLRTPPPGEELVLDFQLPDGEVLGAEAVVTRRRRAGENGPGMPAGFTAILFAGEQRLLEALGESAPATPGPQQRRAPRHPVRALARVSAANVPAGDDDACIENLSQGGAFVKTTAAVPEGTKLNLELDLPDGATANVAGTAVHCKDGGIGIRFDSGPESDAAIGAILEHAATHRRRALVVDDDGLCRRMIGDELGTQGFEVFSASDGTAGLRSLMDLLLGLDLLIVDLHMPGLDGEKLLNLVRDAGGERDLAIIVVSGDAADPVVRQRLEAAGADAALAKSGGMGQIADTAVQVMLRREQKRIRTERRTELFA